MEHACKTIIVTSASSEIDAATAAPFASEDAAVVLGARRSAELAAMVGGLTASGCRVHGTLRLFATKTAP
jgi:NADP-dependent 3-hydroxy acid dehydrogenase YdfG